MLNSGAMRLIPVRLWLFAILSGALQILPFPLAGPVPVWRTAFCWIALTPLLFALTGKDAKGEPVGALQAAALGYVSGVVWYLGNFYWIYATLHQYGGIAKPAAVGLLILFCLYLGLYHALFGALLAAFRRANLWGINLGVQGALLLSPFAWVAVELTRSRVAGLSWDLLGITQVDNHPLMRLAPYVGAYGISFIIAAVNALWLLRITLKQRRFTRPALMGACVLILLLYVVFLRQIQTPAVEETQANATLLQENIKVGVAAENAEPALTKSEMLGAFSQLSLFPSLNNSCDGIPEMAATKCLGLSSVDPHVDLDGTQYLEPRDLIVWPEAPNGFFESDAEFRLTMSKLARAANAPIIVGAIGTDRDNSVKRGYDLYNSADFVQPDGSFAGRYDKMHLVPFGEYVPYKNLLSFAGSLVEDVGEFDPGKQQSLFATGGHRIGTFICYESAFGDEVRQYANSGADVLVNISDDGWYGDTSAAWEHLNIVRMRAIENHRWVLRSTNTGVTAAIDPYGRVVRAAPRHIRTSLQVGFNYEHDITFYAAHGDLFAYLCALITAAGLVISFLRREAISA
jgi:apolipoprotein N-acyltransferase